MRLVVAPNERRVARLAADWIQANAAPGKYLALAVGSTVEAAYRELRGRPGSLEGVLAVSLDELHPLPQDDPRSFGRRLQNLLGRQTGAKFERFNPAAPDPDREARRVERLVRKKGLSACVLGLGANGHLAFNEPGDPFDAGSRSVSLKPSTLRHLGGPSAIAPARGAMTLGLPLLLEAPNILLVVLGPKQRVFSKMVLGALTPNLPASILRLHPSVTLLYTPSQASEIPTTLHKFAESYTSRRPIR